MDQIALINDLFDKVNALSFDDWNSLDAIKRRTEMVIRNIFGSDRKYLQGLKNIGFAAPVTFAGDRDISEARKIWGSGRQRLVNLLSTMIEELQLFSVQPEKPQNELAVPSSFPRSSDVFVVHGHDEGMKAAVARALEKLELDPIILHEQPNQGRTIIEKFNDYANVKLAVVLLSPNDIAYSKSNNPEHAKTRARQNVVFELGYFVGKLGRANVLALFHPDSNFEMPSDYSGVLFTPFDSYDRWQFDLVKELKACGYDVDANKLVLW